MSEIDLYNFFENPQSAFFIVSTAITIFILILRFIFKYFKVFWKCTLISYCVYIIFLIIAMKYDSAFNILGPIFLVPGMLIYGLIPGMIKMCPSNFDVFAWHTIGFLLYAAIFCGIIKFIQMLNANQIDTQNRQDQTGTP